ncbi:hypothetical protein C8J56DRAFT_800476, partial [Mycena floridula]
MSIECPRCHALHWADERLKRSSLRSPQFGICCDSGQVRLERLQNPPLALCQLLDSLDSQGNEFRENLWKYNRAFAFTSLGVREDRSINTLREPVFQIQGCLHHRSGTLLPAGGAKPKYSQLYIYEPRAALAHRVSNNEALSPATMAAIISQNHQYVSVDRHAYEILHQYGDNVEDYAIRLQLHPGLDRRTYNLPTADEVAVILPGETYDADYRDILLRTRQGALHQISESHPAYAPLQYPLLFP